MTPVMKRILLDKESLSAEGGLVIALGFFDGIHVGHQKLINWTVTLARQWGYSPALFTFSRHPLEVIHSGLCFPYLSSMNEKHCIARELGIEYFITIDFSEEFSRLSPREFVSDILRDRLDGRVFVVGRDYRFGFHGSGNRETLEKLASEFGGKVHSTEDVTIAGQRVSSTGIREAIMGGNMELARKCLGRWYNLSGEVKQGKKRGRGLGFPTANLDLPSDRVMPRPGVYGVFVRAGEQVYPGAAHVGERPTFRESSYNLEVHLLNYSGDLYGREITVYFVRHLRDTVDYETPELMIRQIQKDVGRCREILVPMSQRKILENIPCPGDVSIAFK